MSDADCRSKQNTYDHEQSVFMLQNIFTEAQSAEIESAVRRSCGSITLAAQELLSDPPVGR